MIACAAGAFRALPLTRGCSSVRAPDPCALRGCPEEARTGIAAVPLRLADQEGQMPSVEIRRSALIQSSAARTFDLIEAAEYYPAFLPWCADAVILARDESVVVARLTVNYHGLRFDLTTRNPKKRPHWMAIHLDRGPFRRFEGEWRLTELAAEACKIEFLLRYEFDSALVGRLAGGVFDGIANTLVDAFARRAEQAPGRAEPHHADQVDPTRGEPS
jgi:ribosome-associated toxin RatA of RatAB toxin-antitoxin module